MAIASTRLLSQGAPGSRGRGGRLGCVLVALLGALAGAALFGLARTALADDAYITMAYARNLALHGQWALTEGIIANSATSPLNVWLLAAGTVLTGSPETAVALVLMTALAVIAVWLRQLAGPGAALAGVALLAASPVLVSAVGLEVYLCAAVLVGIGRYAADPRGRTVAVGVLCGLSVLARPDLAVAAAVLALTLTSWRRWAPIALTAAVVATPWHAFTWRAFGSALPDTFAAKAVLFDGTPGVGQAVPVLAAWYPAATAATLATLALGALATAVAWERGDRPAAALGLAGAVHLVVITFVGSGPAFYYAAPGVAGLGLCAVLVGMRPVIELRGRAGARPALLPAAAVLAVITACAWVLAAAPWTDGVAPIRVNWATPQQYRAAAEQLPHGVVESAGEGTLGGVGEIGTLAYFAPPGTRVVEFLSDPGRAARLIDVYRAEHPRMEWNYQHYQRRPPALAQWQLIASAQVPGPQSWPMTSPDSPRSLTLRLAR